MGNFQTFRGPVFKVPQQSGWALPQSHSAFQPAAVSSTIAEFTCYSEYEGQMHLLFKQMKISVFSKGIKQCKQLHGLQPSLPLVLGSIFMFAVSNYWVQPTDFNVSFLYVTIKNLFMYAGSGCLPGSGFSVYEFL